MADWSQCALRHAHSSHPRNQPHLVPREPQNRPQPPRLPGSPTPLRRNARSTPLGAPRRSNLLRPRGRCLLRRRRLCTLPASYRFPRPRLDLDSHRQLDNRRRPCCRIFRPRRTVHPSSIRAFMPPMRKEVTILLPSTRMPSMPRLFGNPRERRSTQCSKPVNSCLAKPSGDVVLSRS